MSLELKKRISTSIILFIFALFSISISKTFFLVTCGVVSMICFGEWVKINLKLVRKKQLINYVITIFGFIYLFLIFFTTAISLRGQNTESIIFFIFVLCICISSDVGGYVFGKTIGGKKLTKISPNKTIAGMVGSFIFSPLPLLLFNFINYLDFIFEISLKNILFCLIISLFCQLGDLLISYFKRLNNIKDAGTILPGHGGLLDRIDGIIFSIPVAFILTSTQIF